MFYLGSIQAREVLYDVLSDSVKKGEMTEAMAVEVVKNALFGNANRVYALGLEPRNDDGIAHGITRITTLD